MRELPVHLLHFPAQLSLLIKRLIQINIISEIFMCFFSLHDWAHGNPLELFPHNGDIRSTFDSFNSFPISKTTCLPWYIGYQVICNRLLINCTNVNYLFIYLFFVKEFSDFHSRTLCLFSYKLSSLIFPFCLQLSVAE